MADCSPRLHRHSGESRPGTFLECKKLLEPIFSVSSSVLQVAGRFAETFLYFRYLFGKFWADYVQFPVFSLDEAFLPQLKGFFVLMLA